MTKQKYRMAFLVLLATVSAHAASFVVTNSAATGPGTLDAAIDAANTSAPPNLITFNIGGPVPIVITSAANYQLFQTMSVDATTQPGYSNRFPAIWLSGAGPATIGFNVQSSNSVISGFRIRSFNTGILIAGDSNRVQGCVVDNNNYGVEIDIGKGNLIGGSAATNGNVVSANFFYGVFIYSSSSEKNTVLGNWIGVSPTNSATRMPNVQDGVHIENSDGNIIAGTGAVRQVISGNDSYGIQITQGAASNRIVGNIIGMDDTGSITTSNGSSGIYLAGAPYTRIGGTNVNERNVISGNHGAGILINLTNTINVVVEGNIIGLNAASTSAVPNSSGGIYITQSDGTRIGGDKAGQGNTIAGNQTLGIFVSSSADNGTVQGNFIGVNSSGTAFSNSTHGVLMGSSSGWLIGGTNSGAGNIIAANGIHGLFLSAVTNFTVQGNRIGVNAGGTPLANGTDGIRLQSDCEDLLIGGTSTNAANIIGGNRQYGIRIDSAQTNLIKGNYIGVLPSGTPVSNNLNGILVNGGVDIVIGGSTPGERNVISGNGGDNILLNSGATQPVVIVGNYIGINPAGTSSVFYGAGNGITVNGRNHWIGGTNSGEGNVISGNGGYGVLLNGFGTHIAGNIIGLASNGLTVVSNAVSGIALVFASNCVVGGTSTAERNVVGGNDRGVEIRNAAAISNTVIGNYLGFARDGTTTVFNAEGDLYISAGSYTQTGGRTPQERNVIAHTLLTGSGVLLNVFEGNYLGVDALGRLPTNLAFGAEITSGASSNLFGGTEEGAGNLIGGTQTGVRIQPFNSNGNRFEGNYVGMTTNGVRIGTTTPASSGFYLFAGSRNVVGGTNAAAANTIGYYASGIAVLSSNRNALLGNRIISNSLPAIDLAGDGIISGNDVLDVDGGPNDGQNYPIVTNAQSFFGSTRAQGYLSSRASSGYRIEFFSSPFNVQAARFLGYTNITTDANGTGTFSIVLGGYTPTGAYVRATATDTNGNTSEIGGGVAAVPAADLDNDKMPDYWETANGLNPAISNSPTADADSDGQTDREEYVADTDPQDASSLFEFTTITTTDPGASVSFPSSPNRTYEVNHITDLISGTWVNLTTNVAGTGGVKLIIDESDNVQRIYRARVSIPPL